MSKRKQERLESLCIDVHTLLCALVSTSAQPNPVAPAVNLETAEIICMSAEYFAGPFLSVSTNNTRKMFQSWHCGHIYMIPTDSTIL